MNNFNSQHHRRQQRHENQIKVSNSMKSRILLEISKKFNYSPKINNKLNSSNNCLAAAAAAPEITTNSQEVTTATQTTIKVIAARRRGRKPKAASLEIVKLSLRTPQRIFNKGNTKYPGNKKTKTAKTPVISSYHNSNNSLIIVSNNFESNNQPRSSSKKLPRTPTTTTATNFCNKFSKLNSLKRRV